jgi:hypothetical protein
LNIGILFAITKYEEAAGINDEFPVADHPAHRAADHCLDGQRAGKVVHLVTTSLGMQNEIVFAKL